MPERVGHAFRFVDSRYDADSEARFKTIFPNIGTFDPQPLSLRDIYLTLARHFKGASK